MTRHTILIVDDEPNVLKSLKRLLVDTDYNILMAQSGEEGLEKLKERKIDVVISDYRMPGMNGVEFLSKVKEQSPDTMRLILSGYADAVAIVEAINEGQVYRFITKPWNDQELLTTISTSLEQHNLQQEYEMLYFELQRKNKELETLTKSLEEEVERRTHDLEVKNRALIMARNILSYLPMGVIGVDPGGVVVYMNESMKKFVSDSSAGIGLEANDVLCERSYRLLKQCLMENKITLGYPGENRDVIVMWLPLSEFNGVIGVFNYSDVKLFSDKLELTKTMAGGRHG